MFLFYLLIYFPFHSREGGNLVGCVGCGSVFISTFVGIIELLRTIKDTLSYHKIK